jgi:ferritin-like protein
MTTLMERIANERRRLRLVRQRMAAGIEAGANGDEAYVPFYVAVADYIDTTMQRLHEQDVKMGDMIRDKVEKIDDNVEQALRELDDRLEGATAHLKPFLAARDELREKGAEALAAFEAAAQEYSDFIKATMGHHNSTAELSQKLFSLADWEYMAGITEAQQEQDAELFQRVLDSSPDSVTHISE